VQQGSENVTIDFVNDVSVRPNATGGAVNAVRKCPPCPMT